MGQSNSHQSRPLTFETRTQMRSVYGQVPSVDIFVGLCAYLHVLTKHHPGFTPDIYDSFILGHRIYLDEIPNLDRSYHTWLLENRARLNDSGSGVVTNVLTEDLLGRLSAENPYTFTLTECYINMIRENITDETALTS